MKWSLALVVVVSALAPDVAAAQQWRPERPYRGLFGGGVADTQQLLTVSASAGAGWDKNIVAGLNGRNLLLGDGHGDFQGGATFASTALSYSWNGVRAALGASAGTTARYYPSLYSDVIRRDYASVGSSVLIGGGLSAQGSVGYQPYSLKGLLPELDGPRLGDPAIVDQDFPDSNVQYVSYSGGLNLLRRISRRQTFTSSYSYHGRLSSDSIDPYHKQSAAARLTRALGRGLDLRLGYGYSKAWYGERRRTYSTHSLDVGVDYDRALSFSRRTRLSFGTGTAAARRLGDAAFRFRATGDARLTHEIGRTWTGSISYRRGFQLVETWPEPVFSDSATAVVSGDITSRVQARLAARALRGSHWGGDYGDVATYSGVAGITWALTRYLGTGLTYAYYRHDLAGGVALAPGFPNHFDGQTIRASVSVWAPVFQRARRPE
jgi:hypothetical protein